MFEILPSLSRWYFRKVTSWCDTLLITFWPVKMFLGSYCDEQCLWWAVPQKFCFWPVSVIEVLKSALTKTEWEVSCFFPTQRNRMQIPVLLVEICGNTWVGRRRLFIRNGDPLLISQTTVHLGQLYHLIENLLWSGAVQNELWLSQCGSKLHVPGLVGVIQNLVIWGSIFFICGRLYRCRLNIRIQMFGNKYWTSVL